MTELKADVVLLGGGPAGTATALALALGGYSTVVVERSCYEGERGGETLPPAIKHLLGNFGIWDRFVEQGHLPSFGTVSAWGDAEVHENESILNPYGVGWNVRRAGFDAWLADVAEEAGVRCLRQARLTSLGRNTGTGWRIDVACAEYNVQLRARVLVDATGRASTVARRLGAARLTSDRLVGCIAFYDGNLPDSEAGHTLLEAAENGWWYSARLPDSHLVVAYMTDADLYASARKRGTDLWCRELHRSDYTSRRIDRRALIAGPRVVAANSSRLDVVAGRAWLAVGDAAMAFDPLSSLGVYKALESALHAAQAIRRYLSSRSGDFRDYRGWIQEGFLDYLRQRRMYYARERRWPSSTFWRRRHLQ